MSQADSNSSRAWPFTNACKPADCIPHASDVDVGRRVLRGAFQGWAAVGSVIRFYPAGHASGSDTDGSDSGGSSKTPKEDTHKHENRWEVLYGNNDRFYLTTAAFAYGMRLYLKTTSCSKVQAAFGVTLQMLEIDAFPPGMVPISVGVEGKSSYKGKGGKRKSICPLCSGAIARKDALTCLFCEGSFHRKCISALTGLTDCNTTAGFKCEGCISNTYPEALGIKESAANDAVEWEQKENELVDDTSTAPKKTVCKEEEKKMKSDNGAPDTDNLVCEKCGKVFTTKLGIKYHRNNVCRTADSTVVPFSKRARLKYGLATEQERCEEAERLRREKEKEAEKLRLENEKEAEKLRRENEKAKAIAGLSKQSLISSSNEGLGPRRKVSAAIAARTAVAPAVATERPMLKRKAAEIRKVENDDQDDNLPRIDDIKHCHVPSLRDGSALRNCLRIYNQTRRKVMGSALYKTVHKESECRYGPPQMDELKTNMLREGLWTDASPLGLADWIDMLSNENGNTGTEGPVRIPDTAIQVLDADGTETFLRPFEGKALSTETGHTDCMLNAAGPVWSIAFAPEDNIDIDIRNPHTSDHAIPDALPGTAGAPKYSKYFAVATSRVGWPKDGDINVDLYPTEAARMQNSSSSSLSSLTLTGSYGFASDRMRVFGVPSTGSNLLQIWAVEDDLCREHCSSSSSTAAAPSQAMLQYCVGLSNRGSCNKMSWCPWRLPQGDKAEVLGMLAVVCGDGSCAILVLPKSPKLVGTSTQRSGNKTSSMIREGVRDKQIHGTSDESTSEDRRARGAPDEPIVIPESAVLRWEISIPNQLIQSVSWNPHELWSISCGMQDGTITVWSIDPSPEDIDTIDLCAARSTAPTGDEEKAESSQNRRRSATSSSHFANNPSGHEGRLVTRLYDPTLNPSEATISALRAIEHSPYHPQLILGACYDGDVKIWSLREPSAPLYKRDSHLGWLYAASWDPNGNGLYTAGSETSSVGWEPMWTAPEDRGRTRLYSHVSVFSGVWDIATTLCDDLSYTVSTSSDGSVRGCCASVRSLVKRCPASFVFQLMRVLNVSSSPLNASDTITSIKSKKSWNGNVGFVKVRTKASLAFDVETSISELPDCPTISMQAVDCAELVSTYMKSASHVSKTSNGVDSCSTAAESFSKNRDSYRGHMLAYGGAAGLVRVQTVNLRELCHRDGSV